MRHTNGKLITENRENLVTVLFLRNWGKHSTTKMILSLKFYAHKIKMK